TLADALDQRVPLPRALTAFPHSAIRTWRRPAEVAHDRCDGFDSGLLPIRSTTRRDVVASRTRWQFSERTVEVGVMVTSAGGAAS
ncbi:MAG TPA: hypothetical protein VGT98_10690, partial [Candidatus Elarobacter sp.]|nr:hypothetical protein [Candidatus Elarobacter sp.]